VIFRSRYCGQPVISTIPFPELPKTQKNGAGFHFYLKDEREQTPDIPWTHYWNTPEGEKVLAHGRQGNVHWLHFPKLADFSISVDGYDITCYPQTDIPPETIRHLFLDQVLPRCLAHQGKIMIHASAVLLKKGVLLFIGSSGAGKSTLAGNFHQTGQPAIADDCVWIKGDLAQPRVVPSYGGLRLWEDSLKFLISETKPILPMAHYSSKKRVFLEGLTPNRISKGFPVQALIIISITEEESVSDISLELLSKREAYLELVKHTFMMDVNDMEGMTFLLQTLGSMMPALNAFRLHMRRDYNLLPKVRKIILEKTAQLTE
jgi:energy-coupling factor transporter ATP-binding protein EcfA2